MKPKDMVAAPAAILLLAGASALADDNSARLLQSGSLNSALIDQSPGSGNRAGGDLAARQDGDRNVLEFTQSGDRNAIGAGGAGFLQQSNRNTATIVQSSSDNSVVEVLQTGIASSTGTHRRNTLSITQQGGNGNVVGSVVQTRTRPAGDLFGLTDRLPGNEATILQNGAGNRIALLSQTGRDNRAELAFDGNLNRATSVQTGAGNSARVSVDGSINSVLLEQDSLVFGNTAQIGIEGGWNLVRIDQSGSNRAVAGIEGHSNVVAVDQNGSNTAQIAIEGSANRVAASQTSAANALDIGIAGHGNNALPFFSPGAHAGIASGAGLAPGDIVQNGLSNSIEYDLGSDQLSSGNRFAFLQEGFGNRIEGNTNGNGNQVVVVQEGALNFTSFVQIGNFNVIGVSQQ